MNILITGGFGLIGRSLVSELSNNNNNNIFLISRNIKIILEQKYILLKIL